MGQILLTLGIFGSGVYLVLLGLGKRLLPAKMRGHEEVRWLGQLVIFAGVFALLACFGISTQQINEWIREILTTGGGAGTG